MTYHMKWPVVVPLNFQRELVGVPFETIYSLAFVDDKGESAVVMNRRFASIDAIKFQLHKIAKEAKIYIYSLSRYEFDDPTSDQKRIEYWLRCAYRRF